MSEKEIKKIHCKDKEVLFQCLSTNQTTTNTKGEEARAGNFVYTLWRSHHVKPTTRESQFILSLCLMRFFYLPLFSTFMITLTQLTMLPPMA